MAGYDQYIKVKADYYLSAKDFLKFLNNVGKKYARPVKLNYKYLGRGRFYIDVSGGPGGIDALFQELLLNRGLYYYVCSLKEGNKNEIIKNAIIPLFQDLLEYRFQNHYSRFLRKHILAKVSQEKFIPGEYKDPFSHEYEILFRKWDIGSVDDWNFVQDLDSFLTKFMLTVISHSRGQTSPKFHILVEKAYKKGIGMREELKGIFNKIHFERTSRLHRLKDTISKEILSDLSTQIYIYFGYFDEFQESQKQKTDMLHGKRYRRVKYGEEKLDENPYIDKDGKPTYWHDITKDPCHDCAAIEGQYHCFGCDVEQCPRCKGQRLGCICKLNKDYN